MKAPEQYRAKHHHPRLHSTMRDGNNGLFILPGSKEGEVLACIASDGMGWEHVSVTVQAVLSETALQAVPRTPTWEEMCRVRDLFWSKHVTVLQFHPPADQYVNRHEHCLHLWRQPGVKVPLPEMRMVG